MILLSLMIIISYSMIILGLEMSKRSLESPPRPAWNYPAPRSGAGHRRGRQRIFCWLYACNFRLTHTYIYIYTYICIHIYIYYRKTHYIIVDCRFNYYIYICVCVGPYKDVTNLIGNTYNVMHRDIDVTPLCK